MSLISFIGSGLTTTHLLSQIYRRPEFTEFIQNINDGNNSLEVLFTFSKNFILKKCDPYVLPLLNTPENKNIFKNKNLSRVEQSKLFFGKLVNTLLDNMDLDSFAFLVFTGPINGIITAENQTEIKRKIVEFAIKQLNNIPTLDSATSPTDVYKSVVEYSAKVISSTMYVFTMPLREEIDQEPLVDGVCSIMGTFNSYYGYQSGIYKEEDDLSSSSGEEEVPRKLKRADAMKGLPSGESNSKKPKN